MDCSGCRYYKNLVDNHCLSCDGSGYKKPSNGDRIRAMMDEELAEWIFDRVKCQNCPMLPCVKHGEDGTGNCKELWLAWLREEADE